MPRNTKPDCSERQEDAKRGDYEYRDRALLLPSNGLQDIGERRKLREELQTRCNLTELQAVNIINGFHIPDYVRIAEVRAAKEAEEHEN